MERIELINVVFINNEFFRLIVQSIQILSWPVKAEFTIMVWENIHRFRNYRWRSEKLQHTRFVDKWLSPHFIHKNSLSL